MASQNNNEMNDAVAKAEIRLGKTRDCMIGLIDLIRVYEIDRIEDNALDFDSWMEDLGKIGVIKQLYREMLKLEANELRIIGEAYVDQKAGGE